MAIEGISRRKWNQGNLCWENSTFSGSQKWVLRTQREWIWGGWAGTQGVLTIASPNLYFFKGAEMTRFSFYWALTTLASTYDEGVHFPATKIFLMELKKATRNSPSHPQAFPSSAYSLRLGKQWLRIEIRLRKSPTKPKNEWKWAYDSYNFPHN